MEPRSTNLQALYQAFAEHLQGHQITGQGIAFHLAHQWEGEPGSC